MVIYLEQGANDLHMVQLIPLQPRCPFFCKTQNGLSFLCQLTQVVLKRGY